MKRGEREREWGGVGGGDREGRREEGEGEREGGHIIGVLHYKHMWCLDRVGWLQDLGFLKTVRSVESGKLSLCACVRASEVRACARFVCVCVCVCVCVWLHHLCSPPPTPIPGPPTTKQNASTQMTTIQ